MASTMYSVGSGPAAVNSQGFLYVSQGFPLATNIINGSGSTDGATMYTIPANKLVNISLTMTAVLNTVKSAQSANATVTVVGTGSPTPATTSILAIIGLATSTTNPTSQLSVVVPNLWIYSGTSTATIQLNFGGVTMASASVNGFIIP